MILNYHLEIGEVWTLWRGKVWNPRKKEVIKVKPLSKLFALEAPDWLKGLLISALTVPIGMVYDWANSTSGTFDWPVIGKVALAGGLAYLIKNFFTGTQGKLLTNKPPVTKP
jgi:hypothetical protein